MAMKHAVAVMLASIALHANDARAQTASVEAAQTIGQSTDGVAAAATQLRLFGNALFGTRFHLEAAWAARSGDAEVTDAFGAAYPYGNRVQVMEAYGERTFRPRTALLSVRAGRFRTPFGISSASEHAYSGFLRAPLIRYDGYYALSNNFLEMGASVLAGIPALYVETSFGRPGDVGTAQRRPGLDRTVRLQGSFRSLILGLSHLSTNPYQPLRFAAGRAVFTGVDARWMRHGVEVRGEWIAGQPFDGTRTTGGYVDLLVHRPGLGPVTWVLRAERLGYATAPPRALYAQRYTAGARVRLRETLTAQVNVMRHHGVPDSRPASLDVALTYLLRLDGRRARQ
jgi:hypothetical protein